MSRLRTDDGDDRVELVDVKVPTLAIEIDVNHSSFEL